jgi:branched-chain amino acid transport system ATP-binding protein
MDHGLMTTLLRAEGIEVRYGSALALHDVSLNTKAGKVLAVFGPNGAGKTTLLKALSGLLNPVAGRLEWLDQRIVRNSPHAMVRRGVSHVPEGRRLIADLDVVDNLRIGAVAAGLPIGDGIERVVAVFPALERLMDRTAGQLSGGEQQMVAIGRGLMTRPKLLLVDELSLGLAPKITVELLEALVGLAESEGLGLVLVDQNVRLLRRFADDMFAVNQGTLLELDPDADIETLEAYGSQSQAAR